MDLNELSIEERAKGILMGFKYGIQKGDKETMYGIYTRAILKLIGDANETA